MSTQSFARIFFLLAVFTTALPAATNAPVPMTTAAIQALSDDAVSRNPEVELRAVVTVSRNRMRMLFVQDETGGIYCDIARLNALPPVGNKVILRGVAAAGAYLPIFRVKSIEDLGPATLPEPARTSLEQLWSGKFDGDFVEVHGQVLSVHHELKPTAHWEVIIVDSNRLAVLMLGTTDLTHPGVTTLPGAFVVVRGVCGPSADGNRRIATMNLEVSERQWLTVATNASEMARTAQVVPLTEVFRSSRLHHHHVRVTGTVSAVLSNEVYLANRAAAVLVSEAGIPGVKEGDHLDLYGVVDSTGGDRHVRFRHLVSREPGKPLPPVALKMDEMFELTNSSRLVTFKAEFVHRIPRTVGNILVLRKDGRTFEVRLRFDTPDDLETLVGGSEVGITGILAGLTPGGDAPPRPRIIVASPDGFEVTSAPPWPMARTLAVVSALAVALTVGLLALLLAHKRLRNCSGQIEHAQNELRSLNTQLESRIQSRTRELERTNLRLESEVAARTSAQQSLADRESHLRTLVEGVNAVVWEFDLTANQFTYVSPQAAQFGHPLADWMEPGFWQAHIHPDDRDEAINFCMAKTGLGLSHDFQYRFQKADGNYVWVDDKVSVDAPPGTARVLRGVLIDLTEARRREEAMRESEERFAKAFQASPVITVITRLDDARYINVNDQFTRVLGYTREEAVGRTSLELGVWADPNERQRVVDTLEAGHPVRDMECVFRCKSGHLHTMLLSIERITVQGVPCLLGINHDITEFKRASRLREEQRAVLEMIAQGAPLDTTLDRLARAVEAEHDGLICSILLLDKDGQHLLHGAAPSLPEEYSRAIHGLTIGPEVGSCGSAAARREQIVVEDIETDPRWEPYRPLTRKAGVRACWSTPIVDSNQQLLGTFALYARVPSVPDAATQRLLETATHTAAICIKSAADDAALRENARTLRRNNELLHEMGRLAHIGAWSIDAETQTLLWSDEVYAIHEVDPGTKIDVQSAINFYTPEARPVIAAAVQTCIEHATPWDLELPFITAKGRSIWVRAQGQAEFENGRALRLHGAFQDITERKQAEERQRTLENQLRQSQKMEAIGTLAGGVAHHFNNLLGAIIGCAELAQADCAGNAAAQENLTDLLQASHRAKNLVRQILTFSRQQPHERHVIPLQPVVEESIRLLRAALPATVELRPQLDPSSPTVLADSGLIQQVIINLVTNAAQSLQGRAGQVDIILARCSVDTALTRRVPSLKSGPHVRLSVRDNGCGMTADVLDRIFEPFYTTKGPGHGTGLGLSVVHGIVQNHDGAVLVESRPGEGSTFDIYLPVAARRQDAARLNTEPQPVARGRERILLIDDELPLLKVGEKILRTAGYDVTACSTPAEAKEIFRQSPAAFNLVITDYAMPGQNGVELGRQFTDIRPGIPMLICTGYTSDLTREQALKLGFSDLLQKPVQLDDICRAVRRALDQPACDSARQP